MADAMIKIPELPEVSNPDNLHDNDDFPISQVNAGTRKTRRVSLLTVMQKWITSAAFRTKVTELLSSAIPIASANTLGKIKVGDGLSIDENGVLSVTDAGLINGMDNLLFAFQTWSNNHAQTFSITDDMITTDEATEIPDYFMYNTSGSRDGIKGVNITKQLDKIGTGAFQYCNLTSGIVVPHCKRIEQAAFADGQIVGLTNFDISDVEYIGNSAFYEDGVTVSTLNLPHCTYWGEQPFGAYYNQFYPSIEKVYLPAIVEMGYGALRSLWSTEFHFGETLTTLNGLFGYVNWSDAGLDNLKLYFEGTTPPSGSVLGNTGPTPSTPPFIFVPASAVDTYKAASNFSSLAAYITAIPEE